MSLFLRFFFVLFSLKCFQNREVRNPGGLDQGLEESAIHGSSNYQKKIKEVNEA